MLQPGQSGDPIQVTITPAWNAAYRAATKDVSTPEEHDGRVVAPPLMLALLGRMAMAWIPVAAGAVHAKQSYRFHRPLLVGEEITVQATILDLFSKRNKDYTQIGVRATFSTGLLLGEGTTTRIAPFRTEGGR
ncbi:MaoC family dehydratase [Nocardioides houyundeii]|uniref:MaoC family dehydratase n=1 Tax=Nocardioides houyundeii TaxID=2045452 RepID=UPI000DF48DF8|nr:MaoC family dehydratase [Nocardioides houyundeii]